MPQLFRNASGSLTAAALCLAFGLAAQPLPAAAKQATAPTANKTWATGISGKVKLDARQQALLEAFVAVSDQAVQTKELSADQYRAMTLIQRLNYWSEQAVLIAASAHADAEALSRFYAALSSDQKVAFDEANKIAAHNMSVAADAVSAPPRDTPDYKLPGHTDPTWLIKPTAENVGRVYPFAAARDHIEGKAIIHCAVDEDGYLADCVVESEAPKDQGFGNAALEITGYMRMEPATNFGVPTRGQVTMPIAFRLPGPD